MPLIDNLIILVFHGLFTVKVIAQRAFGFLYSALSSLVFFIGRLECLIRAFNIALKFNYLLSRRNNVFRASLKDLNAVSIRHRDQHRVTNPFLFFDLCPRKLLSQARDPIPQVFLALRCVQASFCFLELGF